MKYRFALYGLALFVVPPLSAQGTPADSAPPHPTMGSTTTNGIRSTEHRSAKAFEARNRGETLPQLIEACWRAEEPGHNRNTDLDQNTGRFAAEAQTRWCVTSIEAKGVLRRVGKRYAFERVDSLTLRFRTDSLRVLLQEKAGAPDRLTVNGRIVVSDCWRPALRNRILDLAQLPRL